MKIIINLLCLVSLLFLMDSCTVTKRHYGGGYHMEWKKNWKEGDNSVAQKTTAENDTLIAQAEPVSKSDTEKSSFKKEVKATGSETVSEKEPEVVNEEPISEPTIQDKTVSQDGLNTEDEIVREEVRNTTTNDELPKNPEVKKKVEPLTWVAFGFFLAAIAMLFIPVDVIVNSALVLVFVLLLIIAFINAVVSAVRIIRNPLKYKAKPFSWIVLFFCFIGFGFALFMLVNYLLGVSLGANA